MASWSVTAQDPEPAQQSQRLAELLSKVMDDDGEDTPIASRGPVPTAHPPQPLNPTDLHTPVKGQSEFDVLSSWVRSQTPLSTRNSPTPNGSYFNASTPTGGSRGGPGGFGPTSPNKYTQALADHNAAMDLFMQPVATQLQHGASLEQIYEQRRLLMAQMEELAAAERELRGVSPNQNSTPLFDPYATSNTASIDQIRGRVYETAKDQHGCRYLQRLLDSSFESTEAAQVILKEIAPCIPELMTDQYANFLVQKLFDIMLPEVRFAVAQLCAPHLTQIALTAHGTFSVQKLIETIATREEMEVIKESLMHDVVRLVKDVHGNHVIQKVLQRFDHPDKQFIYDVMCADCLNLSVNKQGCCVLQRSLEFASPAQRQQVVTAVVQHCLSLVQDPYGNYVVQYVLECNDSQTNDDIARIFAPHIVILSVNKFSSNVMEKMLRLCSPAMRELLISYLCDQNVLARLIQDDYANYVVQTALTVSSAQQSEMLVTFIRPLMNLVKNAPYAKKLEAKLDSVGSKRRGGYGNRSPHYSNGGHNASQNGMGGGGGGGNGGNPYRAHDQAAQPSTYGAGYSRHDQAAPPANSPQQNFNKPNRNHNSRYSP